MEKSGGEIQRDVSSNTKHIPHFSIAAKLAPDIAIDIDSTPFYTSRGGGAKLSDHGNDRVIIDTNLLQAKAQYGGHGVGASNVAAHRKVGTLHYGMARMY